MSTAFCSCCHGRFLVWKGRSFAYWMKLLKVSFLSDLTCRSLSYAFEMEACMRLLFSVAGRHLAQRRKKWHGCIFMPKQPNKKQTTIKSPDTTQSLFDLRLRCQAIQNSYTLYVYMTNNVEIVLQIHFRKKSSCRRKSERKWMARSCRNPWPAISDSHTNRWRHKEK